jgi:predicted nucleotidyltransferase
MTAEIPCTAGFLTLPELKAAERARRRAAIAPLKRDLAAYGAAHGGRFVLYGSAARDTMRHDSDVDIPDGFSARCRR